MRWSILLAALAALPSWADTPYSVDVSDLWWNPAESGWGINLVQQNDMVFATMFVYGPDGRPKWFSASDMKGSYASGFGVSFSGRLVETSGPPQPGAFDPSRVTRRDVGPILFQTYGDNSADLVYTIEGVTVRKQVTRLTMKGANASGEYTGYKAAVVRCAGGYSADNAPAVFRVIQGAGSFSLTETTYGGTCTYTGTPEQRGRLLNVAGSYSCPGGIFGTFELSNASVGYQGFNAHLSVTTARGSNSCPGEARLAGLSHEGALAARASVDMSDLWWTPAESGWGINLQQQDDIVFATLFTYGADGRAKWYSASDMRYSMILPGGLPSFSGALYESTGPAFSTSFNPAAVTRREVGQVNFSSIPGRPDEANIMFSIDGVQYVKAVKRLTMRENDSSGVYRGTYAGRRSCPLSGSTSFTEPVTFTVTQLRGSFSLADVTANQNCTYSGAYEQRGRMLWSSGSYSCTGFLPEDGKYTLRELEVGQEGLIAQIERTASSTSSGNRGCTMSGRIAGARPY